MPDVGKLPKWAQDEISRLRRDLNYWKAKASEGPGGSRVFADWHSQAPRPLGTDPWIRWLVRDQDDPRGRELYYEVHLDGEELIVNASGNSAYIHVAPRSTNSIAVWAESAFENKRRTDPARVEP